MAKPEDPSRPDALWLDAWRGVLFASASILRVAEPDLTAKVGFPLTWLDVLAQLYDAPGRAMRIQEIQERSLFTRSGITRLIDRIEAEGLVRREPVPGDRRGVLVVLTAEGLRRHDLAFSAHLPVIQQEIERRLTPGQQRLVAEALSSFWHERRGDTPD